MRTALADAFGPVHEYRSLAGGDICQAYEIRSTRRGRIFVKTRVGGHDMFVAEADGLRWLAEADAIGVPPVVGVGSAEAPFLALEFVERGHAAADHDERFGRQLASLHRHGAPSFGGPHDNFIGPLRQAQSPCATWPEFYRTRRLEPLVGRAIATGAAPTSLGHEFDRLFAVLEDRCGPPEPPARLHGDLWSGNALVGPRGEPVVIDPAVYGGHREIDLAMMRLFGGFSERVFEAYREVWPWAPGAPRRVALYQLYPLLVHVNLFGGGYVGQTRSALRSLL